MLRNRHVRSSSNCFTAFIWCSWALSAASFCQSAAVFRFILLCNTVRLSAGKQVGVGIHLVHSNTYYRIWGLRQATCNLLILYPELTPSWPGGWRKPTAHQTQVSFNLPYLSGQFSLTGGWKADKLFTSNFSNQRVSDKLLEWYIFFCDIWFTKQAFFCRGGDLSQRSVIL